MNLQKTLLILIALMTANQNAWSIDHYLQGDTLFVWAKSGLNLRKEASIKGEKILTIPYGAYIIVGKSKSFLEKGDEKAAVMFCTHFKTNKRTAINLSGQWVEVQYNDSRGYIFDLYLSHFPPPEFLERGPTATMEDLEHYLQRLFGLREKDEGTENKNTIVRQRHFNRGYSVINRGHKCAQLTYLLPNISLAEILIAISNGLFYNDQNRIQFVNEELNWDKSYKSLELIINASHEPRQHLRIEIFGGVIVVEIEKCC